MQFSEIMKIRADDPQILVRLREGMERKEYTNNSNGERFIREGLLKELKDLLNKKVVKERIDINNLSNKKNEKSRSGNFKLIGIIKGRKI